MKQSHGYTVERPLLYLYWTSGETVLSCQNGSCVSDTFSFFDWYEFNNFNFSVYPVNWSHDLMLYQTCHMMLSSIMLVTWYNSLSDSSHDAFLNYAGHMMRYTMYMYMCIFTYHIAFCPKHVIGLPYKCLLK